MKTLGVGPRACDKLVSRNTAKPPLERQAYDSRLSARNIWKASPTGSRGFQATRVQQARPRMISLAVEKGREVVRVCLPSHEAVSCPTPSTMQQQHDHRPPRKGRRPEGFRQSPSRRNRDPSTRNTHGASRSEQSNSTSLGRGTPNKACFGTDPDRAISETRYSKHQRRIESRRSPPRLERGRTPFAAPRFPRP